MADRYLDVWLKSLGQQVQCSDWMLVANSSGIRVATEMNFILIVNVLFCGAGKESLAGPFFIYMLQEISGSNDRSGNILHRGARHSIQAMAASCILM